MITRDHLVRALRAWGCSMHPTDTEIRNTITALKLEEVMAVGCRAKYRQVFEAVMGVSLEGKPIKQPRSKSK